MAHAHRRVARVALKHVPPQEVSSLLPCCGLQQLPLQRHRAFFASAWVHVAPPLQHQGRVRPTFTIASSPPQPGRSPHSCGCRACRWRWSWRSATAGASQAALRTRGHGRHGPHCMNSSNLSMNSRTQSSTAALSSSLPATVSYRIAAPALPRRLLLLLLAVFLPALLVGLWIITACSQTLITGLDPGATAVPS